MAFNYELNGRQTNLVNTRDPDRRRQQLDEEPTDNIEVRRDEMRYTRNTVSQELKECDIEIKRINEDLELAIQKADDDLSEQAQSRLIHLSERVEQLRIFAPDHAAVLRLEARIQDMRKYVRAARDSFGAGEQGALDQQVDIDQLDNLNQVPQYVGGARRKTTTPTALSTNRHKSSSQKAASEKNTQLNPSAKEFRSRPTSLSDANLWQPLAPLPNLTDKRRNNMLVQQNKTTHPNKFNGFDNHPFGNLVPSVRNIFQDPSIIQTGTALQNGHPEPIQRSRVRSSTTPNSIYQQNISDHRSSPTRQANRELSGGHRIHQWSLRFDGNSSNLDAEDFIFRVERQANLHGVTTRALTIGIGDLLTGRASQWYWSHQRQNEHITWEEWKGAFLRRYPPRRETDFEIRSKIEQKRQDPNETFSDFCQDIEAMAMRLRRRMQEDELIEVLRRNMAPFLRQALWRDQFLTVDELLSTCDEYEQLCQDLKPQTVSKGTMRVNEVTYGDKHYRPPYPLENQHIPDQYVDAVHKQEYMLCWNCRDIGHSFIQCDKPQRGVFCFSCGFSGVMKVNCPKCSGNARKDQIAAGATRPQYTAQPQVNSYPQIIRKNVKMPDTRYPPPL